MIKLLPVLINIEVSESQLLHFHFVTNPLCAIFCIPLFLIQHLSDIYLYQISSYPSEKLSADLTF